MKSNKLKSYLFIWFFLFNLSLSWALRGENWISMNFHEDFEIGISNLFKILVHGHIESLIPSCFFKIGLKFLNQLKNLLEILYFLQVCSTHCSCFLFIINFSVILLKQSNFFLNCFSYCEAEIILNFHEILCAATHEEFKDFFIPIFSCKMHRSISLKILFHQFFYEHYTTKQFL